MAIIDRKYEKPVKLLGKPIKTAWLMVAGLVGLLANLASLFTSIGISGNNGLLFVMLGGFSVLLFSLGFY